LGCSNRCRGSLPSVGIAQWGIKVEEGIARSVEVAVEGAETAAAAVVEW